LRERVFGWVGLSPPTQPTFPRVNPVLRPVPLRGDGGAAGAEFVREMVAADEPPHVLGDAWVGRIDEPLDVELLPCVQRGASRTLLRADGTREDFGRME